MPRLLASMVLVLASLRGSAEGLPFEFGAGGNWPVPEGAKVSLEVDRKERYLGENVLAHFILENTGTEPFQFSYGGDYRGVGRALRFNVSAVDESGRAVESADPPAFFGGGLGGDVTLKAGEKWTQSLPIMRYCRFEQAGRYTLRVGHDLGWKEGERKHPVGEVVIELKMPDLIEAEKATTAMEALPDSPNNSIGQRARDYADFECLRAPVYLAPLSRRLEQGNLRALQGISRMETPEATRELIRLAKVSPVPVSAAIASSLLQRTPLSPEQNQRALEPGWEFLAPRIRMAERAWREEMREKLRELAKMLVPRDLALVAPGSRLLVEVGSPEDYTVISTALKQLLEQISPPRRTAEDNLETPEPLASLSAAANALRGRGWKLPDNLNGNAEILLYLWQLADTRFPRTQRSEEILDAFFVTSHWQMREAAVLALPTKLDDRWNSKLSEALKDQDYGVVRAACRVASRSGRAEILEPIINIVAAENNRALVLAASDAAASLGASGELLDCWADRLADTALWSDALDYLQSHTIEWKHGYSGRTDLTRDERLELRKHWRTFLHENGTAIASGKRFALGEPPVVPGMFGRARQFTLPGGRTWPPMPAER